MLRVDEVHVSFGDVVALDAATLDVAPGSITVVMGPSGCGKSTLLRVIAGLTPPQHGSVSWMGKDISSVAIHERGFGLMFQDYALFPHRRVGANVAFGPRMADWEPDHIEQRVATTLELVGLAGYEDRRIGGLSGGEQQRVALARALAPAPTVLMLDEPIGALDRDLRAQLMTDMRRIFRELELTVIYVTHDQDEAFGLADRVAVMRSGRVLCHDTPRALWERPRSPFVARFMGRDNVLASDAVERLVAAGFLSGASGPIAIDPDAITMDPASQGSASVIESMFVAGDYRTTISAGGVVLTATGPIAAREGERVSVAIDPSGIVHLADDE